jgi:hypothetical protein
MSVPLSSANSELKEDIFIYFLEKQPYVRFSIRIKKI